MKSEDGDETSAWSGMSEGESWFSANSGTDSGSGMRSEVSSKRSRRKGESSARRQSEPN